MFTKPTPILRGTTGPTGIAGNGIGATGVTGPTGFRGQAGNPGINKSPNFNIQTILTSQSPFLTLSNLSNSYINIGVPTLLGIIIMYDENLKVGEYFEIFIQSTVSFPNGTQISASSPCYFDVSTGLCLSAFLFSNTTYIFYLVSENLLIFNKVFK